MSKLNNNSKDHKNFDTVETGQFNNDFTNSILNDSFSKIENKKKREIK